MAPSADALCRHLTRCRFDAACSLQHHPGSFSKSCTGTAGGGRGGRSAGRADDVYTGEVTNGTHFTLDPGGARILEAIARAGGPRFPAYNSMVTLQRHGQVYHALLSEIAQYGKQNVELQSGDVVYVAHEPRYFVAMGALGQAAALSTPSLRLPFEDSHISLADALAKTGGLLDERANATGVCVLRNEPRAKVQALGVSAPGDMSVMVPTVYLVNLRDPAGLFYARKFAVHHEDVLFASNAPATDVGKYLSLIGPLTGSSANVRATGR